MTNGSSEVNDFLGPLLSRLGFVSDGAEEDLEYGGRPAWAVYYRRQDCKLQVCWSAREGGTDFMLATPDSPNEFGLVNSSGEWRFMLVLSDFDEELETPNIDAGADAWWRWRSEFVLAHFPAACATLLRIESRR
jgi:hypothetical protein